MEFLKLLSDLFYTRTVTLKNSDSDCQSGSAEIKLLCYSQAFSSRGRGRGKEGVSYDCVSSQVKPGWDRAAASV